ncbi:MAG TPA: HAD family phosphatase [Anaerolineae bacterium]|nr:HAD family phosphatase [Anaerolineae bacterium]
MEKKYGVLWDMDGVIVDTKELHYKTWAEILPDYGIPFSRGLFLKTFGMNNADTLAFLLGRPSTPEETNEIAGHKEALFRQSVPGRIKPLPGVIKWIRRLKSWDFRQAIASSAPMANIDILMKELSLHDDFDAIVSGSGLPSKPDPSVFLEAARRIDVSPEKCVVIEDSLAGVEAAKMGGFKCIAVSTTNPASKLSNADLVLASLDLLTEDALMRLLWKDMHR